MGIAVGILALGAFAAGAAVVVASKRATAADTAPSQGQALSITCRSPALGGTLPAMVYVPAGYHGSSRRYPVIYFLHGLPADPTTYTQNAFVAAAVARSSRPAIVVAPQGARNVDSDREYLDWSPTEDWPQAIAQDLTRCIDTRYRTIARRSGRALTGLSAGGYGAVNIGLRNLSTFAAVESWSGYFVATDPSGDHVLELGSQTADEDGRVLNASALRAELAKWPSLIAFYVGNQDSRFLTMNKLSDRALTQNKVPHLFSVYVGGHSESLWASHAPAWLGLALKYMSPSASGDP